jgi:glycosyltransferase involved in cell wall biosynthesis
MKIAIDARWIFPEISGIGAYTRELIRHLARIDKDNTYVLFFNDPALLDRTVAETGIRDVPSFSSRRLPFGVFSIRNQLQMPGILARENIDVFHSTNYMIPLLAFPRNRPGRIKCVTTIHDVIPLLFPAHAPMSKKTRILPLYRALMKEIGKRSDAVITDSHSSAADIAACLEMPDSDKQKIHPIHLGVSERFKPSENPATQATPSLLYVGRMDPYKNICDLVRILSSVRKQCKQPVRLTICGARDPRYPEASLLAETLGVADSITWTGYVNDKTLLDLYQTSNVLVHPSGYEGFGLQVLEAMACGLPVVCSSAGSLPEVAGNAAIQHTPGDTDGFTASICHIISDAALAGEMRRKGVLQARKFSWHNLAVKTAEIYQEICRPEK